MYKNLRILLMLFCILMEIVQCEEQSEDDLFLQANSAYNARDFATAYNLYNKISDKTASVNYNLGLCAYNLEKFGNALVFLRRAEREWGFSGRLQLLKSIALVKKSELKNQTANMSDFLTQLKDVMRSLIMTFPLLLLQCFVLLIWIILFLKLRLLYKRRKKMIIFMLFCSLSLSASILAIKYNIQKSTYIVTLAHQTVLYSGPGNNYTVLGHLPEAQEGVILRESQGFYRVKINKTTGWIEKRAVEKI